MIITTRFRWHDVNWTISGAENDDGVISIIINEAEEEEEGKKLTKESWLLAISENPEEFYGRALSSFVRRQSKT